MNDGSSLQGYRANELGPQTRDAFGEEFALLLAERTERFTMLDSTSVRVETAEALARGILYCVDLHLRTDSEATQSAASLKTLYESGVMDAKRLARHGKLLLKQAEANRPPVANIGLNDTLSALPFFFRRYDADFFAHEIPCDIDYPLCIPVSEELFGAEYINEYLRRLLMENMFLRKLNPGMLARVYTSQYGDYDGLLVNLYTPVAEAAVGRALAGKSVRNLVTDSFDWELIRNRFSGLSDEAAKTALRSAAAVVCSELKITGASEREYLAQAAIALLPRIRSAEGSSGLEGLFAPADVIPQRSASEDVFHDGGRMDDVKLRSLIAELQDCRFISDQIAEIRRSVHSMQDLVEVLDVVGSAGLLKAVVDGMGEHEKKELGNIAALRIETGNEKGEWERNVGRMTDRPDGGEA
jgi:hypothetical protein